MSMYSRIAASVLVLALAGCQSATAPNQPRSVSLAEAKDVVAKFEGETIAPPPRTIVDVTAILNSQKNRAPRNIEKHKGRLASKPPVSATASELALF